MLWQPVFVPPSADALLNKARAENTGRRSGFSKTQEFVAALHWFISLPTESQVAIVVDFRDRCDAA
jgi:hypothetical protein